MPLEAQLKGFVAECFTEPVATAITTWLEDEAVLGADGFGLLAASETEVQANITDVAFIAKVHLGKMKDKIAFKKLWLLCRTEDKPSASLMESADTALCDKARKNCEAVWMHLHNYVLAPGRRLVSTQLGPIHDMSHQRLPNPRDLSMLPWATARRRSALAVRRAASPCCAEGAIRAQISRMRMTTQASPPTTPPPTSQTG